MRSIFTYHTSGGPKIDELPRDTAILGNDNLGCLGLVLENSTLFVSPNILRKLKKEDKYKLMQKLELLVLANNIILIFSKFKVLKNQDIKLLT